MSTAKVPKQTPTKYTDATDDAWAVHLIATVNTARARGLMPSAIETTRTIGAITIKDRIEF